MKRSLFASQVYQRAGWLDPLHPIAQRDAHHLPAVMPRFIKRLSAPWTLVGYSALVHGLFFAFAIGTYHAAQPAVADSLMPIFSPFLTPFGTPLVMAFFQSVLYWSMLLGLSGQVAQNIGREVEGGTWGILRLTPYSSQELALTKIAGVMRQWRPVLNTVLLVRGLGLLLIPLAIAGNHAREGASMTLLDLFGGAIFMAQPFAESFMVIGLGVLVATLSRSVLWTRFYTLAAGVCIMGGLSIGVALWLAFTSPIGGLAGLFVPFSHWAALITTVFAPSRDVYAAQTLIMAGAYVLIPAAVGAVCMGIGVRRLRA